MASDLGLQCLPMSHIKDVRHKYIWIMTVSFEPYYIIMFKFLSRLQPLSGEKLSIAITLLLLNVI